MSGGLRRMRVLETDDFPISFMNLISSYMGPVPNTGLCQALCLVAELVEVIALAVTQEYDTHAWRPT